MSSVDPVEVRQFVYRHIRSVGRPPLAVEIGDRFNLSAVAAKTGLAALNIGKTILLHPKTGEIWMAGPFAASIRQCAIGSRAKSRRVSARSQIKAPARW